MAHVDLQALHRHEVRHRGQAVLARHRACGRQHIGVVVAKGRQERQAGRRHRRVQGFHVGGVAAPQDGPRQRTGVFGIDVHFAGDERLVADQRAAETKAPLHGEAAGLQELRQQLGQDVALVEVLAGDDDGLGGGLWRRFGGCVEGGRGEGCREREGRGVAAIRGPAAARGRDSAGRTGRGHLPQRGHRAPSKCVFRSLVT